MQGLSASGCRLLELADRLTRMGRARRSGHPVGARLTAGVLLTGFVFLTVAPVCGSASDVDPEACCQRHGCQRSARASKAVNSVSCEGQQLTCTSCDKGSCSGGNSAEDCCRRGKLAYPVLQGPSTSVSALSLSAVVAFCPATLSLPGTGTIPVQTTDTSPPLKKPLIALYALHSAYRI